MRIQDIARRTTSTTYRVDVFDLLTALGVTDLIQAEIRDCHGLCVTLDSSAELIIETEVVE